MTKTLIADMAATLIEAAQAGESLDRAEAILRVARFGTGAIRAFGNEATNIARAMRRERSGPAREDHPDRPKIAPGRFQTGERSWH